MAGWCRLHAARARLVAAANGRPDWVRRAKAHNPGNPPTPWFPTLLAHQFQSEPRLIFPRRIAEHSIISIARIFRAGNASKFRYNRHAPSVGTLKACDSVDRSKVRRGTQPCNAEERATVNQQKSSVIPRAER